MQEANVPFEMMLYPGYTHRVSGEQISPHRYNTVFRFLESHGVTPPGEALGRKRMCACGDAPIAISAGA